ncbi:MAG: hypothetical protein WDO24_11385 [Pseudomonadota bacterium]
MAWSFETLGNASIQIAREDQPILVTDPWLSGTAYFGSWALEEALTPRQTERMLASPFAWFSHGHPDHLHIPSAERLDRRTEILLPDHYCAEMRDWFAANGFRTRGAAVQAMGPSWRPGCASCVCTTRISTPSW